MMHHPHQAIATHPSPLTLCKSFIALLFGLLGFLQHLFRWLPLYGDSSRGMSKWAISRDVPPHLGLPLAVAGRCQAELYRQGQALSRGEACYRVIAWFRGTAHHAPVSMSLPSLSSLSTSGPLLVVCVVCACVRAGNRIV